MMNITKNIKIILFSMMLTILIPQTIFASDISEEKPKEVITAFAYEGELLNSIHVSKKDNLSLEELTNMMPDTLDVYINSELVSIPVNWTSVGEDYEESDAYYFQFNPVWDEDKYVLADDIDSFDDVPYISVFLSNESIPKIRARVTVRKNEAIIYNFLINEMDLNMAAACGVLANMYHESAFDPEALGDKGTSYGICQWHNTRWEAMKTWCDANGYEWENLTGQLNYLKYELSKNDWRYLYNGKKIYDKLAAVKNDADGAYNAGYYWCSLFEVPANTETASKTRGKLAKDTYWEEYSNSTAKTPSKPTVSVTGIDSLTETMFKWASTVNAKNYNLHIKKLKDGEYKYYKDIWMLDVTSYSLVLPAGDYSVTVEACNEEKFKSSSAVKFTIEDAVAVKIAAGDSFTNTKFTWNKITYADYYNLRIMKKDGNEYIAYKDILETKANSYTCLLPAGDYSVYVESCSTDSDSKLESEIIKFSVVKCKHSKTELKKKKAASCSKNGYSGDKYCTVCGSLISKGKTIYSPKKMSLSTTEYTYNSEKTRKPTVTIKDSKGKKISSKYYTVKYPSGRKKVGKYTVKVTFKGDYSGTLSKSFKILPTKSKVSKVTAAKKAFTVKWKKKTTQVDGYQIQYSTSKKFKNAKKKTISTDKTTSKKISGLKSKKKYYVRVRTYKKVKDTKYYSDWSSYKSIKTK